MTTVVDRDTHSAKRSVYGALYPLAEWAASSRWFLRSHARPGAAGDEGTAWASGSRRRPMSDPEDRWVERHNLRSAGDGQARPDLSIVPQGETTRLSWRPDPPPARPRFPCGSSRRGTAVTSCEQVLAAVASLVEKVLVRLVEEGVTDTPLAKEWAAITDADPQEAAFCDAAARLGMDPYGVPDEVAAAIQRAAEALEGPLLGDFLDAVSAERIHPGLAWVEETGRGLAPVQPDGPPQPLDVVADAVVRPHSGGWGGRPWQIGYGQARDVRALLEAQPDEPFDPDELVRVRERPAPDPGLTGLGGRTRGGGGVLYLGRRLGTASRRFAQARALWHLLLEREQARFLIVPAVTDRHRVERAFAAQLLAPAEGIAARLGSTTDPVERTRCSGSAGTSAAPRD